jgi:hypothetical protein
MPPSASSLAALLQNIYTRRSVTIPTVSILFILVALLGLSPVLQGKSPEKIEEIEALQKLVVSRAEETGQGQSVSRTIYLTWLSSLTVDVKVDVTPSRPAPSAASPEKELPKPKVTTPQPKFGSPEIRPDRFALLVASWVLAVLLLAAGPALVAARVVQLQSIDRSELGAVEVLDREVEAARTVAQALYSRSTLLLMGGIVIAFTGVVIFYLALPAEFISLRGKKMQLAQHVLLGETGLAFSLEGTPSELEYVRRLEYELRRREYELRQQERALRREEERQQEPESWRQPPPVQSTMGKLAEKSPEHFTAMVREMLTPASFGDVLSDHFTRAIRPFGILIFIELDFGHVEWAGG